MGKAEGYVENYLRKRTREAGYLCYKFVSPGIKGVPDEIVIHDGHITFIETKSLTGVTSASQKKRIQELRDNGADVRICNTRELIDDFILECTSLKPLKRSTTNFNN